MITYSVSKTVLSILDSAIYYLYMGRAQGQPQAASMATQRNANADMGVYQTQLYSKAVDVANMIKKADVKVRAVLLYGSVVTGNVHPGSDIDMVILSDESVSARELKKAVPALMDKEFNVVYHTKESIDKSIDREWSYMACVAQTAVVVAGEKERIEMIVRDKPDSSVTQRQLEKMALELENVSFDLDEIEAGKEFKFKFSKPTVVKSLQTVHRLIRQSLILDSAERGQPVWTRKEIFIAAGEVYPELKSDIDRVNELEIYWEATRNHQDMISPSDQAVEEYIISARRIFKSLLRKMGDSNTDVAASLAKAWEFADRNRRY